MSSSPVISPPVTNDLRSHLLRMLRFDHIGNQRWIAAINDVSAPPPEKSLSRLCHVLAAKQLWGARIGAALPLPDSIHPLWARSDIALKNDEVGQVLHRFVKGLDANALGENIDYTSTEGDRFRMTRADMVTHVVLHGMYHRGQLSVELAPLLPAPVDTDWTNLTREQI